MDKGDVGEEIERMMQTAADKNLTNIAAIPITADDVDDTIHYAEQMESHVDPLDHLREDVIGIIDQLSIIEGSIKAFNFTLDSVFKCHPTHRSIVTIGNVLMTIKSVEGIANDWVANILAETNPNRAYEK